MRKLITLTLAVLMVGLFAAVVFAAVDAGDDSNAPGDTTTTETTDTTQTTETTETTETTTAPEDRLDRDDARHGIDVSGPCDEAEHAGDPRCTGAPFDRDDHGDEGHSGPGRGGEDDEHGDDDVDNSGPGGGGSSGHGGGDDSSGHGGGSSSGHGGDD
jgi:hypothetical protein